MEANFSALSLAMNSAMGCWQVSHQHKPGCCNDRKRLSQSAGCSDEFWELSLCAYSILGSHTSLSSPLIRWPSTPGTKTLGMWAMQSCSSETPVQTTNTGVSLRLWASSEGLHPTPPWPRPPPCTQSLWAQIVKKKTKKKKQESAFRLKPDQARQFPGGSSHRHYFLIAFSLFICEPVYHVNRGHNETIAHLSWC